MSRTFMLGILAILVCLMGVVSYLMMPKPPAAPKPPDPAKMKQMQEAEMKSRQEMMKKQMAAMKAQTKVSKPAGSAQKSAPAGGGMDITGDWFHKRQPGEQGIQDLQKQSAEQSAAVPSHQTIPAAKPMTSSPSGAASATN